MAHLWDNSLDAEASAGTRLSRTAMPDEAQTAYEDMLRRTSMRQKRQTGGSGQDAEGSVPRRGVSFGLNMTQTFHEDDDEYEDEEEELIPEQNVVRGHKSAFDDARVALGGSGNEAEMRMRWNAKDMRMLTIVTSVLAIFATGVIPIVDHFIWYRYDDRLLSVTITYWLAAAVVGALGVASAHYKNPFLTSFHVMFGFMLGVCLGAYSVSIHYDMETRCETMQAAFVGCGGCECSWTNECTWANLTQIPACKRCQAYPMEICRNIVFGLTGGVTLTSFMGLLALIFTAVPVTTNLMMLLRLESITGEAFKSKIGLDVVQLEHQYNLVINGEEPTIRPSALDLLIERVRDRGHRSLADKVQAALSVFIAQSKGRRRVTLKSLAQSVNHTEVGRLVEQVMKGKENVGFQRLEDLGNDDEPMEESMPITPHAARPPRLDIFAGKFRKQRAAGSAYAARSSDEPVVSPKAMGYIPSPHPGDKGKGIDLSPSGDTDAEGASSKWSMSRFRDSFDDDAVDAEILDLNLE